MAETLHKIKNLAKRQAKRQAEKQFDESKIHRDKNGQFASKSAPGESALHGLAKAHAKRKAQKNSKFDDLVEELYQERYKKYKDNGSFEYISLNGTGKTYPEIEKEFGKDAAEKAYSSHIRASSLTVAKEIGHKEFLESERDKVINGKSAKEKKELKAFEQFYSDLRDKMTLNEFKEKNPNENLLSRLEQEEKLDKLFSYESIMKRGEKYTKKLDLDWEKASKSGQMSKLELMVTLRQKMEKQMSKDSASELVNQKKMDFTGLGNQKSVRESAVSFYQITGGLGSKTLDSFIQDDPRAYASETAKTINIGGWGESGTIFHEMGHHVEYENPRIAKAAEKWRDSRATGELAELSDLAPGVGYKKGEKAFPGKFYDPYIGRKYNNGHTEVVSMGIQHFDTPSNMVRFYNKDKEHFQFIMGVIYRD